MQLSLSQPGLGNSAFLAGLSARFQPETAAVTLYKGSNPFLENISQYVTLWHPPRCFAAKQSSVSQKLVTCVASSHQLATHDSKVSFFAVAFVTNAAWLAIIMLIGNQCVQHWWLEPLLNSSCCMMPERRALCEHSIV
jgi:hypothetical protein